MLKKTILSLIIVIALLGCNREQATDVMSVSILPQKFFVDQLTGELLEVNVMVPPGASHATYSPTPQQYRKLSDSRLYLGIGNLGYEQAWMPRLSELNPDMVLFTLSDLTEPIAGSCDHSHDHDHDHDHDHHHHHGIDPHIWLSPKVMLELLPHIKEVLTEAYPQLSDTIDANYPNLYHQIEKVHLRLEQVSIQAKHRKFMIFHPALTYLARDYGFRQIAIEQDGKEPSPASLAAVIRQTREENIPVIFIQQEYDIRNADMVSKETGVEVEQINPMAYDWITSMNHLIDLLKTHLNE